MPDHRRRRGARRPQSMLSAARHSLRSLISRSGGLATPRSRRNDAYVAGSYPASAHPLGQRDDDSLRAPARRPCARCSRADRCRRPVRNRPQPDRRRPPGGRRRSKRCGGPARWPSRWAIRLVVRSDKARELDPSSSVGRPQHDDLRPRVRHADDRVEELALHEHAALDLETEADEERRDRVEVGDSDSDMVKPPDLCHDCHHSVLAWSLVQGRNCRSIRDMPAAAAVNRGQNRRPTVVSH
jgi:hypothetical protein